MINLKDSFCLIEQLDEDTQCFKLNDGSTFYFKSSVPQKLYVIKMERIIYAQLPRGKVENMIAHDNAIYFRMDEREIYYATMGPNDTISVNFLRYMQPDDKLTPSAISGILVSREEQRECPKTVHRGLSIVAKRNRTVGVEMGLSGDTLTLSLPRTTGDVFCLNDSPYIYVPAQGTLFVMNADKMEVLQPLTVSGLSEITIVYVRDNVITMTATLNKGRYLLNARLPEGYSTSLDRDSRMTNTQQIYDNSTTQWYGVNAYTKHEESRKSTGAGLLWKGPASDWEQEMSATINELLDKNMELEEKIENLKKSKDNIKRREDSANEEMLRSFQESNDSLEKAIRDLEEDSRPLKENVERDAALNKEIEAANDQLNEEKDVLLEEEERVKEVQETFERLSQEKICMEEQSKENEKSTFGIFEKKKELEERLKDMMKENEELCKSLTGRSTEFGVKKLLAENQRIMN